MSGRAWGIATGSVVVAAVPAMLVSAKTVQATLPLLLIVAGAGALIRGRSRIFIPPLEAATLFLGALLLYALFSAAWSGDPMTVVPTVFIGVVVAWGSIAAMQALRWESQGNAMHIAEGLWIGLLIGLAYAVIEIASDQAIKIAVYNALGLGPAELEPDRFFTWENGRLIAVHPDDLKRNLMPVPLLLWPALFASRTITSNPLRNAVMASLLGLSVAAVFLSPSYTCKLALAVSLLTFVCAGFQSRLAYFALTIAWLVVCFAVVPIVIGARSLELQDAAWLPLSSQLRVVMWNEIAHLVSDAPFFGIGANMTYVNQPPLHDAPSAGPSWLGFPIPHPHNVYLQIWYELGLFGAVLLAGFGASLLKLIDTTKSSVRPFLMAAFAAAAVELGISYNLWQVWFLCLFGFVGAMCALSIGLAKARRDPTELV